MTVTTFSPSSPQDPTRLSVPRPMKANTPPASSSASSSATGQHSRSLPQPQAQPLNSAATTAAAVENMLSTSHPQLLIDPQPQPAQAGNPPLNADGIEDLIDHVHNIEASPTHEVRSPTTASVGTHDGSDAAETGGRTRSSSSFARRRYNKKRKLYWPCRVCGCSQSTVVMVLFLLIVVVAAAIGGGVGGSIFAASRVRNAQSPASTNTATARIRRAKFR
ncbi:hypothetical protein BD289DRAFT_253108 [Coniella lustricola]|uniref:Uncharacterized protein n=1 Tax=Coniella lustricola TaxID=2025994 RepID=A0A2T3A8E8_9PEZI|nr:hypothetical protein BD289DRAFT_253108 [Coniella lustricola]